MSLEFFLQDEAYLRGHDLNHTFYISKDTRKGGKVTTSFKSIDEFLIWSDKQKTKHFYEKIINERVEYYDIDGKIEDNDYWKNDKTTIINDFLQARKEWINTTEYNNKEINIEKDLFILESRNLKFKKSFHIIIRNNFVFKNNFDQKKFINSFNNFLVQKDTGFVIDTAPYGQNQCFRAIDSSKLGSDRVLIRSDYNKLSLECDKRLFFPSWILPELEKASEYSYISNENQLGKKENMSYLNYVKDTQEKEDKKDDFISDINLSNITIHNGQTKDLVDLILETIDDNQSPICDKEYKNKLNYSSWYKLVLTVFNCINDDDLNEEITCRILYEKLFSYYRHCSDIDKDKYFEEFYSKKDKYEQLTLNSLHYLARFNKKYENIFEEDKTYEKIKKKAKSRRSEKEQKFLEQINEKILNKQIESLFHYENNEYISKEDIPNTQEYVKDIVFPDGFRCVGIHAGLGRGKTSALIRKVKEMKPDAKILILSPRISFAKNICAEYNSKLDKSRQFICYKDVKDKKQLNFDNKIVISMEGLHYLESYTPDLLIIDECNANLMAHISDTNGNNLDNNLYQFHRMLMYSKNVVVADAFIGSKICNFFTDLKIPLHVYKYHRKLDRKDAVLLESTPKEVKKEINKKFTSREDRDKHKFNIDPTVNTILKLLKNGKKVYAFFSTKTLLETVEQKTKEYNCLFYSGVSQNTIPDDLDEVWSQYDLIGTTCTITVGINHSKPNVFNTKIIDFNSSSKNNISDAIQSHYRVRNIIDDKIYIKIDENHIANGFPVNIENLEENIQHKVMWYKKNGKCFETVDKYINNLITHNYLENQLSQVAPKKMMIRYLEDCNYNIIQDTEEVEEIEEIEEIEEDEIEKDDDDEIEKDDDEKVNLLKEFAKDCPNFCRFKELETKKMTRKLTQKELNEIDKYWFIQMYTGGTIKGHQEANLPTIALAYRLWQAKFKGNKTIRAMRLEKKLLKGEITIEDLIEKRWDKSQYAELQSSDIIKIQRILEVCKKLGLKHSNDCATVITQESIDDFYDEAQDEYENIRKDLGIRDRRKDKKIVDKKVFTGLLKNCFTESDQSLCNLKLHQSVRKKINGKVCRTNTYKLYPDTYVCRERWLINCEVKNENEKEKEEKYSEIGDEVTQMLYENMDLRETEQEKPRKRLLKKK